MRSWRMAWRFKSIRARAKKKSLVGWAPVGWFYYPVSDKPEDIEAGRRATMRVANGWNNCWYARSGDLGPLSRGRSARLRQCCAKVPVVRSGNHVPAAGFLWFQFLHGRSDQGRARWQSGPSQTCSGLSAHAVLVEGYAGGSLLGAEVHGGALQASHRHHGKRHVELRLGCVGWRGP